MTYLHDQALPAGTQIGVYEIKDTLKIGAFDITYRAWNHHLKEQVDIQEYFPHDFAIRVEGGGGVEPKSPDDQENFEYGLKAFLAQAELLTQIEHPNIVAVENILQLNGTAYLVKAHPEGASLSRVAQPPASLGETELRFILNSILGALQKVHEVKLIHGDIQPATILLGKNGEPLLTDFAAARLAMAARMFQLDSELAMGYAPAEQYEPRYEPGPASDFYALGATLYYCMTHQQPVAPHDRIIAISKGEPDPMVLPVELGGAAYSAEWLKAVDWMLRPNYNDRPQSTDEILALLKSAPAHDQGKPVTPQQETMDVAKRSSATKHPLGIGVTVGVIALIAVGLWFGEKTSESLDDQPKTVTAQPIAPPEIPEEPSVTLAITQSSQPENDLLPERSPSPTASISVTQAEPQDNVATEPESDGNQQSAAIDQSLPQPRSQNVPEEPIDEEPIKAHLAAAEKAMKAVRFTTPRRDNAYKYYQRVLAIDPDNADALSGLQRIVDRYVQFIAKARIDGRLDEARLYLQRAESVLPDDPKLNKIRAELAGAEE